MTKRELFIAKMLTFENHPYIWGGYGWACDCSGIICRCLWRVEILPWGRRMIATGLYNRFGVGAKRIPGNLAFFGPGTGNRPATHVEMVYNKKWNFGAVKGGSKCKTIEDASKLGAMVDYRPHSYMIDKYGEEYFRGYADPFGSSNVSETT